MIPFLVIALCLTLIGIWLTVMYLWWQSDRGGISSALTPQEIALRAEKVARLTRRGWYSTLRYINYILAVMFSYIARGFFALFPKAAQAFEKKDVLTGLTHGPSSFFLLSISESRKKVAKKKILS